MPLVFPSTGKPSQVVPIHPGGIQRRTDRIEPLARLIDQDAIVDALKNHRIMGAALDVYNDEPLPEGSPYLELDNVTLTTHIAGSTAEALTNSPYLLLADMAKFLRGEECSFIVNKEVLENPEFKAWLAGVRG